MAGDCKRGFVTKCALQAHSAVFGDCRREFVTVFALQTRFNIVSVTSEPHPLRDRSYIHENPYNGPPPALLIPSASQTKMSQFPIGWNPFWAWVCSVLDPQDSIKELLNCVLRAIGYKNGGLVWTAACQTIRHAADQFNPSGTSPEALRRQQPSTSGAYLVFTSPEETYPSQL